MVLPHDFHPLHMNQDSSSEDWQPLATLILEASYEAKPWGTCHGLVPSKKGNIGCKLQIEMEDTEMIYYTYYTIDFILCRWMDGWMDGWIDR